MAVLPRGQLIARILLLATLVTSCRQGEPAASAVLSPSPVTAVSTRVEVPAGGQLGLLVDTPDGITAFGADHGVPWALHSNDGSAWEPIEAPSALLARELIGSADFDGTLYVLMATGELDDARLELLTSADGVEWSHSAPAILNVPGIWGVGIVALDGRLVVVGATGEHGRGRAHVFVSSDGESWEHLDSPELTRDDGSPVGVAALDGRLALLFSPDAGGGSPHVVTSDPTLASWAATTVTPDSPSVTVITPFLDGFLVAGCPRLGVERGLAWVSASADDPFKPVDLDRSQCFRAGASRGDQVALASTTDAWFLDRDLRLTEEPFLLAKGASAIIGNVVHHGPVWVFGGAEYPGGSPLGPSRPVVWAISR